MAARRRFSAPPAEVTSWTGTSGTGRQGCAASPCLVRPLRVKRQAAFWPERQRTPLRLQRLPPSLVRAMKLAATKRAVISTTAYGQCAIGVKLATFNGLAAITTLLRRVWWVPLPGGGRFGSPSALLGVSWSGLLRGRPRHDLVA